MAEKTKHKRVEAFADEVIVLTCGTQIHIEDWRACESASNKKWRAISNPDKPNWMMLFGATRDEAYEGCLTALKETKNNG